MPGQLPTDARINALMMIFQATINAMRPAIDKEQLALNLAATRQALGTTADTDTLAMFDILAHAVQIESPMGTATRPSPDLQVILGGLHQEGDPDEPPSQK